MIKKVSFFVFFLFISLNLFAGNVFINESGGITVLSFDFGKQAELIEKKLEKNRLTLKVKGEFQLSADQLWDKNINKITSTIETGNTTVFIDFEQPPLKYDVVLTSNGLKINFEFPQKVTSVKPESGNVFLKMIVSIFFILVIILIFYWLVKVFMKKNYLSDIPGVGRSLGRIDVMPGKTIIFYEIKDIVYMFGVSGDNIHLIDRIDRPDMIDAIKAGFSKKENFSSYFRFFGNSNIKDEIKTSSTIIQDKVESLKKKN